MKFSTGLALFGLLMAVVALYIPNLSLDLGPANNDALACDQAMPLNQ